MHVSQAAIVCCAIPSQLAGILLDCYAVKAVFTSSQRILGTTGIHPTCDYLALTSYCTDCAIGSKYQKVESLHDNLVSSFFCPNTFEKETFNNEVHSFNNDIHTGF